MKIIKRNGTEEVFDEKKILNAITKANESDPEKKELTDKQIKEITKNVIRQCEELSHTPAVEEIQDLVESEIMRTGAYDVAKRYITYRYKRALVRKANTTDEKILSLLQNENEEVKQENSNKNPTIVSVQRDYMAGEVSKDISRRILLPEEIVKAHDEGVLHFHE